MDKAAFEFVNTICDALGRRVDELGIDDLSEPEQAVSTVWWATFLIRNGGFQYFYEGAVEGEQVAQSFERLGLPEAAAACRKSLEIFPDGIPPDDDEQRCEIISHYQGARNEFFRPLNEVMWQTADNGLEHIVEAYIRSNSSAFRGLDH